MILGRNGYSRQEHNSAEFNVVRTPAGVLQAIPLGSSRTLAHVESDTPPWQSVTARNFYAVLGTILTPLAFIAYAFAAWALTSQMDWTSPFLFADGPFSHWIVWMLAAVSASFGSSALTRIAAR